ncbi:hypothetical protein ACFYOK_35965 [Microbispora bryophytorum]|uniref:hypothetical protein n=1 Tax=Microbispora bryophytorum TaxID=1460882 RepID=UPI0033F386E7
MRGVNNTLMVRVPTDSARRRNAAWRMLPLPCGHHDPLDCLHRPDGPSTFDLTPRELYQEIQRRIRDGWQPWEIEVRFGVAQ